MRAFFFLVVLLSFLGVLGVGVADDTNLVIEAKESLEWNKLKKQYIARGGALIKQGNRVLTADEITATYSEETDSSTSDAITYIEALGSARLEQLRFEAMADAIIYERGQRRVVAKGSAIVLFGEGQSLEAEEIIVILNSAEDDFVHIEAVGSSRVGGRFVVE